MHRFGKKEEEGEEGAEPDVKVANGSTPRRPIPRREPAVSRRGFRAVDRGER